MTAPQPFTFCPFAARTRQEAAFAAERICQSLVADGALRRPRRPAKRVGDGIACQKVCFADIRCASASLRRGRRSAASLPGKASVKARLAAEPAESWLECQRRNSSLNAHECCREI